MSSPEGIAVDGVGGKIYWTDFNAGKIQRANLDGTGVEDLVTAIPHPRFIDLNLTNDLDPLIGDINGDGVVNIFDLVLVGSQFGLKCSNFGSSNQSGDINGDGVVNVFDLVIVGSHFDESIAVAAPSSFNMGEAMRLPAANHKQIRHALAELEVMVDLPRGAGIAMDFLCAWLVNANPIVTETELLLNYPNPFNLETWMPYDLAADANIEIAIYNVDGHRIRRLVLGTQPVGLYRTKDKAAYWDGRSDTGELVSSGLYFYHLRAGDFQASKMMILLK